MSEPNWELKDRRIAWQTITKALAEVQAALISSKLVKFGSLKEAMHDLDMSRMIELEAFLNIPDRDSGPSTGGVASDLSSSNSVFSSEPVVDASTIPPPKKQKKVVEQKEILFVCSECRVHVDLRVKEYSEKYFGVCLCYKCQDEYRARRAQVENANGPDDLK